MSPRFALLAGCFALSGAAGLVYQTAWAQEFATVFGTSELAVVTVLSAYMGGLALGAAVAGRHLHRVRAPVRAYALLELGIAVSAMLVPWGIALAGRALAAVAGTSGELPAATSFGTALYYVTSSFALLLIPTGLMGATLPLLASHAVRSEEEIGPRVGALYACNTGGAVAGTLLTAFVLLPRLGLGAAVAVGAILNVAVFLLAWSLARSTASAARSIGAGERPRPGERRPHWVLFAMLASGIVSFTHEIVWTRLLSHLVGGSVYAFATMLATFLAGITLGAALGSRLARRRESAVARFAGAQLAAAASAVAGFVAVGRLIGALDLGLIVAGVPLLAVAAGALVLLPLTVAIGATFPLAVRILATRPSEASVASARVFAWNTVGAILGAFGGGYLLLPALGFAGTGSLCAATSAGLGAVAAVASRPRRRRLIAASGLVAASIAAVGVPTPWTVLRNSPLAPGAGAEREAAGVAFFAVGRSATVLASERPNGWMLKTNGLPEALIQAPWSRAGTVDTPRWLTLLPLVARPAASSLLVVGLGGGSGLEELPAAYREIHVVELEPEVLRANRELGARRRSDPLADPRIRVTINDARGALRLTERRFDAIVSQPSHPWTSGASHLFTREFFEMSRARLTEAGVFVQWMGLPFVDARLLRSIVATLLAVFEHVEVFHTRNSALLFVASERPLAIETTASTAVAGAPRAWGRIGVLCGEDILAARLLDSKGARRLARGAMVSSDRRNLLQFGSPLAMRRALTQAQLFELIAPLDALQGVAEPHRLYTVRRLIRSRSFRRARALVDASPEPAIRAAGEALLHRARSRDGRAEELLLRSLAMDPEQAEALSALLLDSRGLVLSASGEGGVAHQYSTDPAAAVVEAWRLGEEPFPAALDARLAAVPVRHPLFAEALRLRAKWRVSSGLPARAEEALELLEPMLVPASKPDLLLWARAAAVAGRSGAALSAVAEAVPLRSVSMRRQARSILEGLGDLESRALERWRTALLEGAREPLE